MQLIRWHDTVTDESTDCTSGASVIAPSAVTTLFRISISIYDYSIATLLLCETRTRVPYIASTTLVHRNIVNIVISKCPLSFIYTLLSQNAAIKPALQLDPV
jgi:hypothetical protein